MDKLRMQTANKADENFRKLAAMFPNAVTETINENGEVVRAIDKDVLMQEISCTVVDGNEERYQFTWPDKKKSVLLANAPINKTLRPVREDETVPTGADSEGKSYCSSGSVDFDATENLYIEGDNLEALKLLQETYLGKIKMIYIDPPYNTGNDFVYEDDFEQSMAEYISNSGQLDEEGNRLVKNLDSSGRYHTDWLNMLYTRIKIAKDLLSDDGLIFLSIDDNEMVNLSKLCDEVFGEANFIAQMIWKSKPQGGNDNKYIIAEHEYILVYAKNINLVTVNGKPHTSEKYTKKDEWFAERGMYATAKLDLSTLGYRMNLDYPNEAIELSDEQLLRNIQTLQNQNNIKTSTSLVKDLGRCSLDIEMETGTGKTYVYIKTMFELNKRYGWSKFIVVVPSIAIREGVKKSFEITVDHFMEYYGKKARFFIYNSSNLNQLDNFSSSSGINVMIINTQAFASSLKEDGKSKEARIIYSPRDEFGSRRPIDVIKANRPIIILDEPQKMGGDVTQKALKNFNPLFSLNYSATHAKQHNLVYVLDALDAFNKRLVKKIEVKGFEVKNLRGTDSYLYFEEVVLSGKKPPMAKIELEIGYNKSINREFRILGVGDDLYFVSQEMEQYKGYTISYIEPGSQERGIPASVTFTNGKVIKAGNTLGDVSEKDRRRIQIRETILSHFEKEEDLFKKGIKCLSLFFIDEVAKYRQYDENGDEVLGEYGVMFEQEYLSILNEHITVFDTPYQRYLKSTCSDVSRVHKGYFSIDKKTGHSVDSQLKRGSEFSDDISAYDLILKNKERLLSFDEPTRFIFSHSALREGWDNPNVFQICTLKHSDSNTAKRQEVGRGLRLCVNQDGNRMDVQSCGDEVHKINKLTVIASESYKTFIEDLQSDIKNVLYDRPTVATSEYFKGKYVKVDDVPTLIADEAANAIEFYLIQNGYVDMKRKVTDKYRQDIKNGTVAELPEELKPMADGIHMLIQAVYDDSVLKDMFTDGHAAKIKDNPLNENFKKAEFQALWHEINHKYAYTVDFDSAELIRNAIAYIDAKLFVSELQYTTTVGYQKTEMNEYEIERGASFTGEKTRTQTLKHAETSQIKYDLIGKVAEGTVLTRRTVSAILQGIRADKLYMFKNNPEEFITKVIRLINEQKATMIVEHISYDTIEGEYDSAIFTAEKAAQSFDKAFLAKKAIQDYVFTDGSADKSIERKFAEDLDAADEVCVYAKLPRSFQIPTPVGNYSPDWAIAFYEGTVKHIFFIAETKGTMESLELRPIEQAKISCAKKLFNEMSTSKVVYHNVDSYQNLLNIMNAI